MNDLPYAFYESVFWVGWTSRDLVVSQLCRTAEELSGNVGIVAQKISSTCKENAFDIRGDQIVGEARSYLNSNQVPEHLWIEKDKFVYCVDVHISWNEDKVSKEINDRIFFPNAAYCLVIRSDTVGKAWIDWACANSQLTGLDIRGNLSDEEITLCKRLIATERLTEIRIQNDTYSEGVMEMMKLSLTQPQFKSLCFVEDDHLEQLLAFWSQNKEALRGKDLFFETPNAAEFLKEKLELCPQEEFDPIGKHHFYFPRSLFTKPSHPYKLKYGGDSHTAYVFFSCFKQKPNESELCAFEKTRRIGILFT